MKTPLPIKFPTEWKEYNSLEHNKINEIITCLAELTEVVEGKQDKWAQLEVEATAYPVSTARISTPTLKDTSPNAFLPGENGLGGQNFYPSLKEQLLEALPKRKEAYLYDSDERGYNQALDDVKAIINSLIP